MKNFVWWFFFFLGGGGGVQMHKFLEGKNYGFPYITSMDKVQNPHPPNKWECTRGSMH